MLECGHHTVVAGVAHVINGDRAGAAAYDLVALSGIRNRQRKTRVLVLGGRAVGSGCSWLYCGRSCGHNAGAAGASGSPYSGDEDGRAQRRAHRIMHGPVPDVVNLGLPAMAEVMLNAECPLDGVGRVELAGHHNVLGLGVEDRF